MHTKDRHEAPRTGAAEQSATARRQETYKHLEDPMRLGPFTLLQWTGVCGSLLLAVVFGLYLSPLPPGVTIGLSLFFAGLPLALSYAVSGLDMAISHTLAAFYRWARGTKHYLPGGGAPLAGYVVVHAPDDERHVARAPEDIAAARRQLEGAWDL